MSKTVSLHYHRPPNRSETFEQLLLYQSDEVIVTLNPATPLRAPMIVDGNVVFENGAPAIWFTFPGLMHDIGRFHTAEGTFTGLYANIVMPVEVRSPYEWSATDLFLDIWFGRNGEPHVLDEDEFDEAVAKHWISNDQAIAAQAEITRILSARAAGTWPPAIVNEWTIERVFRLQQQPKEENS